MDACVGLPRVYPSQNPDVTHKIAAVVYSQTLGLNTRNNERHGLSPKLTLIVADALRSDHDCLIPAYSLQQPPLRISQLSHS